MSGYRMIVKEVLEALRDSDSEEAFDIICRLDVDKVIEKIEESEGE